MRVTVVCGLALCALAWIAYGQFVLIPRAKRGILETVASVDRDWVWLPVLRERYGLAVYEALDELAEDGLVERMPADTGHDPTSLRWYRCRVTDKGMRAFALGRVAA